MNKKIVIMLAVAVIAAMVLTAFPLHIEPGHNSDWPFVITIGSPVSAQEADYTCDGAADDVQFQAALNALPGAGGQLFVLAGNYTFADSTTVTRAIDHVSIIGVSAAVSFTGDGVTAIFTAGGDGWLFSNIEADSGGLNMGATTDYMWLHVIVDSTYYPLKTDAINIEDHSALHGVGGADTIFPADPDADKYLFWDDDPGELVWSDAGAGDGDMQKATYDTDEDGDIDTAAGGTEWDSSAATGVAYITAGAWGTRSTGISNTYIVIVDDADAANGDIPYFTTSGLAGYNEAEFKSAYNMEAGTDYQAYDAELAAVAGLTSAANKMIYFTGSGTADVADLTAFARSILDDADEATFKATVNLEIGTDVLAQQTIGIADNNLLEVDGSPNANEYARFTASGLEGRTEAEFKGDFNLEIGTDVQAYDAELAAIAGLTSAADKLPYFTGSGTADVTGLSAFTRGFLDDADEATFKATVNLEIGTDVLAYDATLASIADLGTAADKIAYTTDVDTWAETGLTAFARSILDDANAVIALSTLGIGADDDVQFGTLQLGNEAALNSIDAQVYIIRECNDDGGMSGTNGHGFSDSSDIDRSGDVGYNSFDAFPDFIGTQDYDHYAGFQSRPTVGTSGQVDDIYGYAAYDPGGAGTIVNNYGFYADELDRGTTSNYAFYSAGSTPSYFGGNVEINGDISLPNVSAASAYQTDTTNQYVPTGLAIRLILQSEAYDNQNEFDNYSLSDTAGVGTDTDTLVCTGKLGNVAVGDWIWDRNSNTYHKVTDITGAPNNVEYSDVAAGELANGEAFTIYRSTCTITNDGLYMISLEVTFQLDAGTRLVGFVSCNDDATFITRSYVHGSSTNLAAVFLTIVYDLDADDELAFFIFHDCAAGKQLTDDRQYTAATITKIA